MDFDKYIQSNNTSIKTNETIGLKAASYKKMNENFSSYYTDNQKQNIIETKPILTNSINNTHFLSLVEDKYNKDNDNEIPELSKSNFKKPSQKNDYITQFYIGSLSAVGLYILFRYLYVKK
jgi:hypothetical protein